MYIDSKEAAPLEEMKESKEKTDKVEDQGKNEKLKTD